MTGKIIGKMQQSSVAKPVKQWHPIKERQYSKLLSTADKAIGTGGTYDLPGEVTKSIIQQYFRV